MPRWSVHGVCCATSEGLPSVSGERRRIPLVTTLGGWRRTPSRFFTGFIGFDRVSGPFFAVAGVPLAERGFLLSDSDPSRLRSVVESGTEDWPLSCLEEVARVSQLSKLTFLLRLLFRPFRCCFDTISAAFWTSPSV